MEKKGECEDAAGKEGYVQARRGASSYILRSICIF